jgi:HTH-type transcriptional regulator / antitoxin HipB
MSVVRTTYDLGASVRVARRDRGWTQADLAEAAGISRPAVIGLERGNPHGEIGIALRVLAALGKSITLVQTPSAQPDLLDALLKDLESPRR